MSVLVTKGRRTKGDGPTTGHYFNDALLDFLEGPEHSNLLPAQIKVLDIKAPANDAWLTRGRYYGHSGRLYVVASGSGVIQSYEVTENGDPIPGRYIDPFLAGCIIQVPRLTCYRFAVDERAVLVSVSMRDEPAIHPSHEVFLRPPAFEVRAGMIGLLRQQ